MGKLISLSNIQSSPEALFVASQLRATILGLNRFNRLMIESNDYRQHFDDRARVLSGTLLIQPATGKALPQWVEVPFMHNGVEKVWMWKAQKGVAGSRETAFLANHGFADGNPVMTLLDNNRKEIESIAERDEITLEIAGKLRRVPLKDRLKNARRADGGDVVATFRYGDSHRLILSTSHDLDMRFIERSASGSTKKWAYAGPIHPNDTYHVLLEAPMRD